jgi:hypothetical protein
VDLADVGELVEQIRALSERVEELRARIDAKGNPG